MSTTTPLLSRAELGMRPPRSTQRSTATVLTAHYGGPSPWGSIVDRSTAARFLATADHARCPPIWRAWQDFHMDSQGWQDVGYNSGTCPHGSRLEGRGPGVRSGAHRGEINAVTDAVCYIAGAGDPLTDPAKRAFLDEAQRFGRPITHDHSRWSATACAGDPIRAWIAAGTPPPPGGSSMSGDLVRFFRPPNNAEIPQDWHSGAQHLLTINGRVADNHSRIITIGSRLSTVLARLDALTGYLDAHFAALADQIAAIDPGDGPPAKSTREVLELMLTVITEALEDADDS